MRLYNFVADKFIRDAKKGMKDAAEQYYRQVMADFLHTVDEINQLDRFTDSFNRYRLNEYRIHTIFKTLIFPKSVTVLPGNQCIDYRSRAYRFCDSSILIGKDNYEPRVLSPGEFDDAFITMVQLLKVYPTDTDFIPINREAITFSGIDRFAFMRDDVWQTAGMVTADFPIPVELDFVRPNAPMSELDEEFMQEFVALSIFNRLQTR